MQRGFIQIPILLVILIGIAVLGSTGYVAYEAGQRSSQYISQEQTSATTTTDIQAATSTNESHHADNKGTASQSVFIQTEQVAPAPVQIQSTVSADLLIEKCKAQRDASRAKLWPVFLETVKLAEQKTYQSRVDALMAQIQPGTVPASYLASAAKISDAEHEKSLEAAEATMDAELTKEYSACLDGN
jgi:hypothetical protein